MSDERQGFYATKDSPYFFDRFVFWFRTNFDVVKEALLLPPVKILYRVGLRPNHLSVLGFVCGVSAPLWLYFTEATWPTSLAIVLFFVFDGMDGTMARHYKLTRPAGKWVDILIDLTTSAILLFGIGVVTGHGMLGGLATAEFVIMEALYFWLLRRGVLRAPMHGHLAANVAFILTWYTFGIWLHIFLNTLSLIFGLYFAAQVLRKQNLHRRGKSVK
ncbi:MAG: hypothetical protein A3F54_05605 [Candidatus Kerfeldbacteria bacterium RIFCSPHIGHO2_12_FULL_48_17]|uniref:CDP-alcohol phosphatidyltransferase n=1 Tax=Candidatus Kerfeldbacteria bacterium RIFCSPHIGHO2_12_FULL_48_17 TaxID=1798542 RepID=A0A1G2B5T8_9BACT|nr:MAG: hypothetical protein A3F54_05605 [Candidatus Kerfeldbacteria bacterium RIFCSPHIGHO2_12_FULL_48_17]